MDNVYIHIGYPKNLSTTLQVDYFSKHPDIYHLGTGLNHNTGYIDNKIEAYFENVLFYANELMYQEIKQEIVEHVNYHYYKFKKSDKKVFGLSLEHISFSFTPADTDIYLKFKRINEIFGNKVKIIALIRNQAELIKSLYRESIRIGYPYTFKEYIDFLYYFQNYSYLQEVNYDRVIDMLSNFFPVENIVFLPIENFRGEDGKLKVKNDENLLVRNLDDTLGISNQDIVLNHNNQTLSKKQLYQKLELNKKIKHELGNTIYEPVQKHRLKEYFKLTFGEEIKSLYGDVKKKRLTLELSEEMMQNDSREIDYYADPKVLEKLQTMFHASNERLSKKYSIDLPDTYFNIEF